MNSRVSLVAIVVAAFAGAVVFGPASAQRASELQQMRQAFSERSDATLAEPYRGITSGAPERDLFPIRATGVSTEHLRLAAQAFLAALTPEQRARTTYPVDDVEWRKWANQDIYIRQGVSFLDMTDAQREKAFDLIRAGLSAKGFTQTRNIMRLNYTLGELNDNNFDRYGEWPYYLTVMGEPSATEPWGWQFDGHHAVINYFVLRDQVVMTPLFAGSEPVIARTGKYAGTVVLQDEQTRGLAMLNALDAAQRKQAIVSVSKTGNNNISEAFKDNQVLDYAGIRATALNEGQRRQLIDLVGLFVSNMREGHARVRMDESAPPSRAHVLRVDRQPGRHGLLLPHPQPGDPDRIRPPGAGWPAPSVTDADPSQPGARPHRDQDAQRQRLWEGSPAAALRPASALTVPNEPRILPLLTR